MIWIQQSFEENSDGALTDEGKRLAIETVSPLHIRIMYVLTRIYDLGHVLPIPVLPGFFEDGRRVDGNE